MQTDPSSELLKYKVDRYQAVTLEADSSPLDANAFDKILENTLNKLREEKLRGVWLRLNLEQSIFIPIAVKYGFEFHHAKDDYMLMSHWLPQDEPNKLPHYATHFVGVGGIVINEETDEILVMQERVGPIENFDFWKIPGGLVDQGEHVTQAVEREVFEETGIKAKFHSVLGFREKLVYKWNQPDLYFMCVLKPLTYEIKIDPVEVKQAQWMKIDKFLNSLKKLEAVSRMSKVIGYRTLGGIEKIKNLDEQTLIEMSGYSGEQYSFKFGNRGNFEASDNVFFCSNLINKLAETKPSL